MPASRPQVLHLIDRLSLGGAGRSLITAAAASSCRHRILSLREPDPAALQLAESAGIAVSAEGALADAIVACDILHIHFWNTPDMHSALRRSLPAARVVMTSHVEGSTMPHILTDEIRRLADRLIVTTPATSGGIAIPPAADFSRLRPQKAEPLGPFTIGFVGTLDFAKLHPAYVSMHAAIPGEWCALVAGEGGDAARLQRQAADAGLGGRFAWLGYRQDIGDVLARTHVFGYPLRRDTFATAELVLHEAMYMGLPSVLLPGGGAAATISDGETGLLVSSPDAYAEAIMALRDDSSRRQRLGAAAAEQARREFGAANIAPRIDDVYFETMALPKAERRLPDVDSGHAAWLQSLGRHAATFHGSLAGESSCDEEIIAASPALASPDAGGVLHFRRAYPDDPVLRYWSGLVLLGSGRCALAAAEFVAAGELGFDLPRCTAGLARARGSSGASYQ